MRGGGEAPGVSGGITHSNMRSPCVPGHICKASAQPCHHLMISSRWCLTHNHISITTDKDPARVCVTPDRHTQLLRIKQVNHSAKAQQKLGHTCVWLCTGLEREDLTSIYPAAGRPFTPLSRSCDLAQLAFFKSFCPNQQSLNVFKPKDISVLLVYRSETYWGPVQGFSHYSSTGQNTWKQKI